MHIIILMLYLIYQCAWPDQLKHQSILKCASKCSSPPSFGKNCPFLLLFYSLVTLPSFIRGDIDSSTCLHTYGKFD